MTEIHVEETPEAADEGLAEHEASMAAGAAAVHQKAAGEAADEAEMAAEAALAAAEANAASVGAAESAAASAAESAAAAQSGAQAVAEAINAQSTVIQSLVDELRASRESTPPAEVKGEPVEKKKDRAPAHKKQRGSWYYGR